MLRPWPVPERVGEPSVFEHVVYIIKENRTYDQVLGDVAAGNGDESLCVFGAEVTPNQHKMARQFVLLDNTYCAGILSADGHQWSDSGFATDYMEKSFAGFPRSYPDGMGDDDIDALAYAPSGFLWDNAIAHGKRLRVYGEFAITVTAWRDPSNTSRPTFLDYYHDFVNQTHLIEIGSRPAIESLRPYLNMKTVGWDMDIPDVFRAAQFIKELREFERRGEFPHLVILGLPPMNQLDATATPMSACFTNRLDLTPFDAVPTNIPLDQMNPEPENISEVAARRHAVASAQLPLDKVDQCPEDLLNRILWHAMKGADAAYPEWAVSAAEEDD